MSRQAERNGFSAGDDVDSLYRSYCATAFSTDIFPDCVRHNRKKSSVMVSACLYRLGICRPDLSAGLSSEKAVREPWRRGENYDLKEGC